jgi:hypothetical protein
MPLSMGTPYELHIRIGLPEIHPGGTSSRLTKMPNFGAHDTIELLATLYSHDFTIAVRNRTFLLHKFTGSDDVFFAIVPEVLGECRIRLSISTAQELELLHEIELGVPVARPAKDAGREVG